MARLQVADGGTASNMENSYEYVAQEIADSWQGVDFHLGVSRGANIPPTLKPGPVMKPIYVSRAWTDPLVRPKQKKST